MNEQTEIARNVRRSSELPNRLVIRGGVVVDQETGQAPTFPSDLEGMEVNVVPHHDLKRIMDRKDTYKAKLLVAMTELERVENEQTDAERLRNLLARIHRDGGHYVEQHGIEAACEDADDIVVNLYAVECELREQLERSEKAAAAMRSALENCERTFRLSARPEWVAAGEWGENIRIAQQAQMLDAGKDYVPRADLERVEKELTQYRAENDILRAILPKLNVPCVHCGETDIARCKRGFPGCAQADDLMVGEDETFRRVLKERDRMRDCLELLDRLGGLGFDKHQRIREALLKEAK